MSDFYEYLFSGGRIPISDAPAYEQRENLVFHSAFENEKRFFTCMVNGDLEGLKKSVAEGNSGIISGILSADPLRDAKYSAVSICTVSIRVAIVAGVSEIDAYNISDVFIRDVDEMASPDQVWEAVYKLLQHLTEKIAEKRSSFKEDYELRKCIKYIDEHTHMKITLNELAGVSGFSPAYLSRLFHKRMHVSLTEYILRKKIEEANQLLHTEKTISEIAYILGFNSQSYFTYVYRKYEGITPSAYRRKECAPPRLGKRNRTV